MTTWKTTTIAAVVHRVGDNPIIHQRSTTVRLCDEAGGPFLQIEDCEGATIQIDHDEFELVAEVARKMIRDFDDGYSEDQRAITESKDEDEDDKETIRPTTSFAATCDLLAVIHRDGGQHTGEVGTVQSCKDAEPVVRQLMSDIDLAISHAQIVNCLFRYIDRMNDVCDEDPADTILREFVADVMPFINDRICAGLLLT